VPEPRDSQRQRVYDAEQVIRGTLDTRLWTPEMTTEECRVAAQKFINKVCKRKYITRKYGADHGTSGFFCNPPMVRLGANNKRRTATAFGGHTIEMPAASSGRWAFVHSVLLHELAHNFERRKNRYKYAGHDWPFAAIYLDLVRNVMGREAYEALKASFKKHKVRTKPKGKRNLSPEQREAARQRMLKARAVREAKLERKRALVRDFVPKKWEFGQFEFGNPARVIGQIRSIPVTKHPRDMTPGEIEDVYRRIDKYEEDRKHAAIPKLPEDPFSPEATRARWQREVFSFVPTTSVIKTTGVF
jgi:putative metallohydrolase (TIGR04338 family)